MSARWPLFAAGFAAGIFSDDAQPGFTYGFGAAALLAIVLTLSLPAGTGTGWRGGSRSLPPQARWRRHGATCSTRSAKERQTRSSGAQATGGVLGGSLGYMAFDIAALGLCFIGLGHAPGFGVLVFAYLIGQLGGLFLCPAGSAGQRVA